MKRITTLLLGLVVTGSVFAFALQYSGVALGYGYGYGVCTASRPEDLDTAYTDDKERIEFSWAEVLFTNCATDTPASYTMQIRRQDATLIAEYTNINNPYKRIDRTNLKSNKSYKFRVRAVAVDNELSEWSLYTSFRTQPAKPKKLAISKVGESSARVSWQNVARSSRLRYYQVVVKRGDRVTFSKRVRLGLRRNNNNTVITNLKSGKRYQVKIRAVARSSSKGMYAKKRFTFN